MKRIVAVLSSVVLLGLTGIDAAAQAIPKLTCATWSAERSQGGNRALLVQSWLDGYLAGFSIGRGDDFVTEQQASYRWMDGYCQEHPLENAEGLGMFLINEQLKKKKPYKHQY